MAHMLSLFCFSSQHHFLAWTLNLFFIANDIDDSIIFMAKRIWSGEGGGGSSQSLVVTCNLI